MTQQKFHTIHGRVDGNRTSSRILEEQIQDAVAQGQRNIEVVAHGQHGIGGRLWKAGDDSVHVKITGSSGQRVGSFGFSNTLIEVMGPASDDLGWLNAGAEIVVHGNAANGACNAMAQGKAYVAGNIGSRGMTMTKANPRFAPPELWVLGSVGDYFGEFMAGGTAVICGHDAHRPENVLGYRPLVGMVRGRVFFRGPHDGFSRHDAKMAAISDDDWQWLCDNLKVFLEKIGKSDLLKSLTDRSQWQLLVAREPNEKAPKPLRSMSDFRSEIWDRELGEGGLIGDLDTADRSPVPLITTGELRRFVPYWENKKYAAPCEASCPTGIPVQQRWQLVRNGLMDEAVDLALTYTPFPATVCGYLCPNLCMTSCTRRISTMAPVDIRHLGKASIDAGVPELPPLSGKRIAVIGGGPAGISIAWQLRQTGHEATIYDMGEILGGKLASSIPHSRIPKEVVSAELERIQKVIPHVNLKQELKKEDMEKLENDYDAVVVAVGASRPRTLPVPGAERMITALDFLVAAKTDGIKPGKRVVIIGAGNVGCDVATEAHRLGAEEITLLDVQKPASFGKEREDAEAAGAVFKWPVFTKEITGEGVMLQSGELIPADTVFVSIGDQPNIDFLPETVEIERGFVKVNEYFQTTDPKIFAVGDVARPGLLTDAIGAGRKASQAICDILDGNPPTDVTRPMIDKSRVTLEYFDPRIQAYEDVSHCGEQCASCGACRDCGVCVAMCPETAISKVEKPGGEYEYVVDGEKCIGCGFCAQACPCGVWNLVENEPLE